MKIEGLRSGHDQVGGIAFFGRTLDKIRLHSQGVLPDDYNLGHGLDGAASHGEVDQGTGALCLSLCEGEGDLVFHVDAWKFASFCSASVGEVF